MAQTIPCVAAVRAARADYGPEGCTLTVKVLDPVRPWGYRVVTLAGKDAVALLLALREHWHIEDSLLHEEHL